MRAGTWLLTEIEDGEPGQTRELDLDGAQEALAEFFAMADSAPEGAGFVVRRATVVDWINAAEDHTERMRRKNEVFHEIYGMRGPEIVRGSMTGRMVVEKPPYREIAKTRAGTPGRHLRRIK